MTDIQLNLGKSRDPISLYKTTTSHLKFSIQHQMFTHYGRDDCCNSRGMQQLLEEAVAIVERFHQSPLLPGTLKTRGEKGTYRSNFVIINRFSHYFKQQCQTFLFKLQNLHLFSVISASK